jgi:hypothetical protein
MISHLTLLLLLPSFLSLIDRMNEWTRRNPKKKDPIRRQPNNPTQLEIRERERERDELKVYNKMLFGCSAADDIEMMMRTSPPRRLAGKVSLSLSLKKSISFV